MLTALRVETAKAEEKPNLVLNTEKEIDTYCDGDSVSIVVKFLLMCMYVYLPAYTYVNMSMCT